jgi:spermidine synthase
VAGDGKQAGWDDLVRGAVDEPEVLERVQGLCGELLLRRAAGELEIILNGAFLISTANDASSRAMISAALPHVTGETLEVLVGGLGLGFALDEALANGRVAHVTVAEYEPSVERWFRALGGGRAERAAAGERAGRATVVIADVADVLAAHPHTYDLVSLDTDNGPEWLARDENAGLYSSDGVALVRRALRPGGAVVFWSTDRYPAFRARLSAEFARVLESLAYDCVDGRRHEYVMYVALCGS